MLINDNVRNQILQASRISLSASDAFGSLEPILNAINYSNQIQEITSNFADILKPLSIGDNALAPTLDIPILSECISRIDWKSFASPLSDCAHSISEVISEYPEMSDPSEAEKIAEKCEPACDAVIKSLPEEPLTLISEFRSLSPLGKLNLIIFILTLFFTAYSSVKPAELPKYTVTNNYTVNITVNSDESESETDTHSNNHEPDNDMRERIEN